MPQSGTGSTEPLRATCQGCGTTVVFEPGGLFATKRCPGCGGTVVRPTEQEPATIVRGRKPCPNCLKPLRPNARRCIFCGYDLQLGRVVAEGDKPAAGREHRQARVLIVEDDPSVVAALSSVLRGDGHTVAASTDAVTALATARRERPDLIILDLGLPGGDGLQVMERLHYIDTLRLVPVIVLSSKDPDTAGREALESGARIFLEKPFDPRHLLATVQHLLNA